MVPTGHFIRNKRQRHVAQIGKPELGVSPQQHIARQRQRIGPEGPIEGGHDLARPPILTIDIDVVDDELVDEGLELVEERLGLAGKPDGGLGDVTRMDHERVVVVDPVAVDKGLDPLPRRVDDIGDEKTDQLSNEGALAEPPAFFRPIGIAEPSDDPLGDLEVFDRLETHRSGPQAVFEIVGLLGDLVGHRHRLAFEVARPIEGEPFGIGQRKVETHPPPGVFEDPLADLVGEVEPGKLIPPLEQIHHPEGLVVVLERAGLGNHLLGKFDLGVAAVEDLVEGGLTGVAEGGVAEVVAEGDGLDEIFVEPERPRDGSPELRHFEGVGQPGSGMIRGVGDKDLGLVLESAERPSVEDPVAVALKGESRTLLDPVGRPTAYRFGREHRPGGEAFRLLALQKGPVTNHRTAHDPTPPAASSRSDPTRRRLPAATTGSGRQSRAALGSVA